MNRTQLTQEQLEKLNNGQEVYATVPVNYQNVRVKIVPPDVD